MTGNARALAESFDLEKLTPDFSRQPLPDFIVHCGRMAGEADAERLLFPHVL